MFALPSIMLACAMSAPLAMDYQAGPPVPQASGATYKAAMPGKVSLEYREDGVLKSAEFRIGFKGAISRRELAGGGVANAWTGEVIFQSVEPILPGRSNRSGVAEEEMRHASFEVSFSDVDLIPRMLAPNFDPGNLFAFERAPSGTEISWRGRDRNTQMIIDFTRAETGAWSSEVRLFGYRVLSEKSKKDLVKAIEAAGRLLPG
ncbi:MAG: hypothetical protein MK085_07060 [Phycisphaerales bacterium]|nr:hypothetical protein [Phycisphaerales bacterium]